MTFKLINLLSYYFLNF